MKLLIIGQLLSISTPLLGNKKAPNYKHPHKSKPHTLPWKYLLQWYMWISQTNKQTYMYNNINILNFDLLDSATAA